MPSEPDITLDAVVEAALGGDPVATQRVLAALAAHGVGRVNPASTVPIVTAAGRVLCLIATQPEISLREMSGILGIAQSYVGRQVTRLVDAGLVQRTRVPQSNRYKVDTEVLRVHPDVVALTSLLAPKKSASAKTKPGSSDRL